MFHTFDAAVPKILILEDTPQMNSDLQTRLKNLGYMVSEKAANAERALTLTEQYQSDLVLMNIEIGDKTKWLEAAERIREKWGIPVIFLANDMDTDTLGLATSEYPLFLIRKPYLDHDLTEKIETALYVARLEKEKRKAENAARTNEERINGILSSLHETIIAVYDREGNHVSVWCDPHLVDRYGLNPADIVGTSLKDLMPMEVAKERIKALQKTFETGERLHDEFIMHMPKGDSWNDISLAPVYDQNGRIVLAVGFIRDITKEKRAADSLRESEERFKQLYERAPLPYQSLDERGNFIEVNQTWLDVLGYSREEVIGRNFGDFLPEDWKEHFKINFPRFKAVGEILGVEFEILKKDGSRALVAFNGKIGRDDRGDFSQTHCIFNDITQRKQAEEALRESEERYRRIVETANEGIWVIDKEYKTTFVNSNMAEMLGYTPDEMLEQPIDDFLFPEDLPDHASSMARRMQGESQIYERRFKHKNGLAVWAIVSATPIKDSLGEFNGSFGMFSDITLRKQAEESLRESENRLRDLSNASFEAIFISEKGICQDQNLTAELMFGYTLEEAIGRPGTDWIAPEDREIVKTNMQQSYAKPYEVTALRKDGSTFPAEIQARSYKYNNRNLRVTALRDITDRKLAEEALRESESIQRILLANLPAGVFVVDPETRIIESVNDAAASIFGSSKESIVGRRCHSFICPASEGECPICDLDQEIDNSERELICSDRSKRFVLKSVKWVQMRGKRKLLEYFVDVTDHKKAEEENMKLQVQLQQAQKMEAIGTLAGGIAHDFNNLLQVIKGHTQILLIDKEENDSDFHSLEAIRNAGSHAAALVRQLLLFSRRVEAERRLVDINPEIGQAIKILARTIPKMVEIEFKPENQLWPINADPIQMEQILLNLGKNAADAMPEGGRLLIETGNVILDDSEPLGNLDVKPGRYVLWSVSDTGAGMDETTRAKIFEPFFTTKELGKGTGLGLASVYGIVRSHDGYIDCHSEVGQGTTFKIYIPAIEQVGNKLECGPLEISPQGGKETILLVDDEASIRDFASKALRRFGYTALTASSGEEALEVFSRCPNKIDLVILDIGMPGMGGHRCFRELLERDPGLKIIIASGYPIAGQVKSTVDAGAVGYMGKPYQLDDLLKKIRSVLDQAR